jgi:hypothetical protein
MLQKVWGEWVGCRLSNEHVLLRPRGVTMVWWLKIRRVQASSSTAEEDPSYIYIFESRSLQRFSQLKFEGLNKRLKWLDLNFLRNTLILSKVYDSNQYKYTVINVSWIQWHSVINTSLKDNKYWNTRLWIQKNQILIEAVVDTGRNTDGPCRIQWIWYDILR